MDLRSELRDGAADKATRAGGIRRRRRTAGGWRSLVERLRA